MLAKRVLISLLFLAGCADFHRDRAGYVLPQGSLTGTAATVAIVPQEQVLAMAARGGVRLQRGETVNALTLRPSETSCFIYLADTPAGFAALEHELWHCRLGQWHP